MSAIFFQAIASGWTEIMFPVFTTSAVGSVSRGRGDGDPRVDDLQLEWAGDYERARPLAPFVLHRRLQPQLQAEDSGHVLRIEVEHAGCGKADRTVDTAHCEAQPDHLPWLMVESGGRHGGVMNLGAVEEEGGCQGAVADAPVDVGVVQGQHDGGVVGYAGICRARARNEVEPLQLGVLGGDLWQI